MKTSNTKEQASLRSARDQAQRAGRSLRSSVARADHAVWHPGMRQGDPIEMLIASGRSRLQHLLPLRYGRMSHTPFTYMRGAAAMMAADVAACAMTGIQVQACGDCHLGNFGAFASPERRVLFDINDFDETLPASWEFDLKRLAVSFVLLARQQGYDASSTRSVAQTMLSAYRLHLQDYARQSPLDNWYALIDSELLIRTAADEATRKRRIQFEKSAQTHRRKLDWQTSGRAKRASPLPGPTPCSRPAAAQWQVGKIVPPGTGTVPSHFVRGAPASVVALPVGRCGIEGGWRW